MERRTGEPGHSAHASAYYVLSRDEVAALEADAEVLHAMCLEAVRHVVDAQRFADFGLPEWSWEAVAASWRRRDPHLRGRLDLRYDGHGPAKLLDYTADTPDGLPEAAIRQRRWLMDAHPADDQWNSVHERLVERWAEIGDRASGAVVHVAGDDYLRATAIEAGLEPAAGSDAPATGAVVCKADPWAAVLADGRGRAAVGGLPGTVWVEPLWKVLVAAPALLAVLWEMYPGHPNLLPAFLDAPGPLTEYVSKPRSGGVPGEQGDVHQLVDPLPDFDGYRPALGVWIVGDGAAGLGIRETAGEGRAASVPHRVV
ncbi:glutathionylspermidine synthase family protein [Pseudonocardia nigra]|uniref:glutathionylspermidine synthase family protein n=1 Tax=Pseudonocardia nigra TaxID=1921578 RepID=UPI001C5DFD82